MKLHEIWEQVDIDTPFYYERFDHKEEKLCLEEYDPKDRFTRGADNVLAIKAEILPEIGAAIICVLE